VHLCGSHKKRTKTRYDKLVFLLLLGSTGHVVHSGMSRREHSAHYFSSSDAPDASHKKCVGTHYAEHVFLHLLGSASHIVGSGASGVQSIDALFFRIV
jgi:hypothetical protein